MAKTRIAKATRTKRLYPSKVLVRKKPPESCPPNVLNTAGITAPINTINPPTQMPSARNSRLSAQVSHHLVRRLTSTPAPRIRLVPPQSSSSPAPSPSIRQTECCGSSSESGSDQLPTAPADRRWQHRHRLLPPTCLSADRRLLPERWS